VHLAVAHANVGCTSCHKKHEDYPHPEGIARPACADCHKQMGRDYSAGIHGVAARAGKMAPDCSTCHDLAHNVVRPGAFEFRQKLPETCANCHEDVAQHFAASVHGRKLAEGVADAPVCTSCHGEHAIRKPSDPASTVNARNIRETCGQCHGNVRLSKRHGIPADRVSSFDESFHGLAAKAGSVTVANCASCHGVHDILPSSDPRSSINPRNLSKTCGKCHQGAGKSYAIGAVHLAEGEIEPVAVGWVRWFYLIIIPLTLGFMFLHNAGDWIRKLIRLRSGTPRPVVAATNGRRHYRMYPLERVQHVGLAVSFIVLAWSGFALAYPARWWALPLTGFEGVEVRRNIHRVAAVVFMVVSLAHVVALLSSRELRRHWTSLVPRPRDVRDAIQQFAYNLGLRKTAPVLPDHSYIAKAEYWAVVWGGVLMSLTGLLLWANSLAMQYLPKSWLDVATTIHWYEAVLAAAAIVIWHFYSVILDPDVYPLDTAFITGYSVRTEVDPLDIAPVTSHASDTPVSSLDIVATEQSPRIDGQPERPAPGA
jgi:cytochrome b subunit of formate dehydrogenase